MISCYSKSNLPFFEKLKSYYGNILIANNIELDDRLSIYQNPYRTSSVVCPRVFFEFPIDYYGNVRLCCFDWKNTFPIGNIIEKSLKEVFLSHIYQELLHNHQEGLSKPYPEVCGYCVNSKIKSDCIQTSDFKTQAE